MQIHCQHCHRPFGLDKEGVHAALEEVSRENLVHYDIHCPHCGKSNHVSRNELQRAAPEWKKTENKAS